MTSCDQPDERFRWAGGELPSERERQAIDALRKLDGTTRSAVRLLTGATDEEIDRLGGISG